MFKKSKKFFCCLAVATSLLASSAIVYAQSVSFSISTERNDPYNVAEKASKNPDNYDNYAYFKVTSAYRTGSMNLWSQNLQNSSIQSGRANFHSSELNVRKIKEYNVSRAPSGESYQLNAQYGNSPGGQYIGLSGWFTP